MHITVHVETICCNATWLLVLYWCIQMLSFMDTPKRYIPTTISNLGRNEKVDPFPVVAPSVAELCNKHLTPHCAHFSEAGEGCLYEDLRYPLAAIEEALLRYSSKP